MGFLIETGLIACCRRHFKTHQIVQPNFATGYPKQEACIFRKQLFCWIAEPIKLGTSRECARRRIEFFLLSGSCQTKNEAKMAELNYIHWSKAFIGVFYCFWVHVPANESLVSSTLAWRTHGDYSCRRKHHLFLIFFFFFGCRKGPRIAIRPLEEYKLASWNRYSQSSGFIYFINSPDVRPFSSISHYIITLLLLHFQLFL